MSTHIPNKWFDAPSRLLTTFVGGPIVLYAIYVGGAFAAFVVLLVGIFCAIELQQMIAGNRQAVVPLLVIVTAILLAALGLSLAWLTLPLLGVLVFFSLHRLPLVYQAFRR